MLQTNKNKVGEIHKICCVLQANKNKEAKMTSSYFLFCLHRHLNSKKQQKLQLISRLFPAHYSHITLFPTSAKENNLEAIVSFFQRCSCPPKAHPALSWTATTVTCILMIIYLLNVAYFKYHFPMHFITA